ncbi:16811_t:CDS:2, partial [Gigaspora rosea]
MKKKRFKQIPSNIGMGRIISKLSKKDESINLQRSQTEFRYVD